jgi:hypothetical protein
MKGRTDPAAASDTVKQKRANEMLSQLSLSRFRAPARQDTPPMKRSSPTYIKQISRQSICAGLVNSCGWRTQIYSVRLFSDWNEHAAAKTRQENEKEMGINKECFTNMTIFLPVFDTVLASNDGVRDVLSIPAVIRTLRQICCHLPDFSRKF